MLSLPLIPPPLDSSPILPQTFRPRPDSPPPHTSTTTTSRHPHAPHHQPNPHLLRQNQLRRDEERKTHNTRSPLALLTQDEASIAARKHAIRNFGAYWIRPPGVGKTLQAMNEEEVERAEQEELARQERGMADLQAQQQVLEVQEQAANAEGGGEGGEGEVEERDLDEEIPDADADVDGDGEEEEEEEEEEESFNEESMLEGSSQLVDAQAGERSQLEADAEEEVLQEALEQEEAVLTGAARDEEELGISTYEQEERNLDDSVPEAGSYQHTDTEVEDSDSDSPLQDSFAAVPSARRSARPPRTQQPQSRSSWMRSSGASQPLQPQIQGMGGGLQERMRAQVGAADASLPRSPGSLHLSSSILDSSFVGDSPVMQRGGRGGRRARGRARLS